MRRRLSHLLMTLLCVTIPLSASIIKRPPAKPVETTYKELPCSEQDQSYIGEIISILAENSKLSLLFKQSHLKEMGAQISHVHPLKFLSTIFTNPHLKSCMYYIWNDYFKRNGFMDGLGPSLTRESEKGKLLPYLKEFASEVGAKGEDLREYIDARDWDNLVLYLIQS